MLSIQLFYQLITEYIYAGLNQIRNFGQKENEVQNVLSATYKNGEIIMSDFVWEVYSGLHVY